MQFQNFELTVRTLRNFQYFCKCLESTLEDLPADKKSRKTPGQKKVHKKRRCNKNNNKESQKHYCVLHGHNPTYSTKQYHTLKKEVEKVKKKVLKIATTKTRILTIIPEKRKSICLLNYPKNNYNCNATKMIKSSRISRTSLSQMTKQAHEK